jgi:hypothetical protein
MDVHESCHVTVSGGFGRLWERKPLVTKGGRVTTLQTRRPSARNLKAGFKNVAASADGKFALISGDGAVLLFFIQR